MLIEIVNDVFIVLEELSLSLSLEWQRSAESYDELRVIVRGVLHSVSAVKVLRGFGEGRGEGVELRRVSQGHLRDAEQASSRPARTDAGVFQGRGHGIREVNSCPETPDVGASDSQLVDHRFRHQQSSRENAEKVIVLRAVKELFLVEQRRAEVQGIGGFGHAVDLMDAHFFISIEREESLSFLLKRELEQTRSLTRKSFRTSVDIRGSRPSRLGCDTSTLDTSPRSRLEDSNWSIH